MANASRTLRAHVGRRPGLTPPRPLAVSSRASQGAVSFEGLRVGFSGELGGVMDIQRARLIAACAHVMCERGAANVTVAHIVARAGVSRRTFYEIFKDAQDAVRCALEDALESAIERVSPAWQSEGVWQQRIRNSLVRLLGLFDEDPILARLLVVESLAVGHEVLLRRSRVLAKLVDAVAQGERQRAVGDERRSPRGTGATRLTAEGVVGGVLAVLHERVCRPSTGGRLVELTSPLMSMIVLPYQGVAAARREADRPVPASNAGGAKAPESGAPLASDPFKDAGMRLTYRTMRVLEAISEQPGCSNRQVGELADISDQGQISKLLARLEGLALISNRGDGHVRGEANVWRLTSAGWQVTAAYASYTHTRQHKVPKGDEN